MGLFLIKITMRAGRAVIGTSFEAEAECEEKIYARLSASVILSLSHNYSLI